MKKLLIGIITFALAISMSIAPVFCATSGTYEYNDFSVIRIGGSAVQGGAFRSENASMSSFKIAVQIQQSSYQVKWQITGSSSWTTFPTPSGYRVDVGNFGSQAYCIVNGSRITFSYNSSSGTYVSGDITTSGYPTVYVYCPYVATTTSTIPTNPILSISGNQLSWTPTGYNTRVLYSSTGTGVYDILTESASSPYTVTDDGFYYVQLWYTEDGVNKLTDTSNKIEYNTSSSGSGDTGQGGLLNRILVFFQSIVNGLNNAYNTIAQFFQTLGHLVSDLFEWLPSSLQGVFIAVIIVGLVLGLFLK